MGLKIKPRERHTEAGRCSSVVVVFIYFWPRQLMWGLTFPARDPTSTPCCAVQGPWLPRRPLKCVPEEQAQMPIVSFPLIAAPQAGFL